MSKKISILHVEDDLIDAILIKEMLISFDKHPEFDIIHEECVLAALKTFAQAQFDLILLDVSIGTHNGMDVISLFKNINPEVPIVMLTGNDNNAFAEKSIQKGAQDYVVKGYTDPHFLSLILQSAIQRHKGQMIAVRDLDYDPITGCLSKKTFLKVAAKKFQEIKDMNNVALLSMVNVNNIKDIHYEHSEKAALSILRKVADYLKAVIGEKDIIAHNRYGSFFLLMNINDYKSAEDHKQFVQNISEFLRQPVLSDDNDKNINLSASISYATCPYHGSEFSNLLNHVQHTMYEMRHYGGKQIRAIKQYA